MAMVFKYCIVFMFLVAPFLLAAQSPAGKQVLDATQVAATKDTSLHFDLNPIDIYPDKKDLSPKKQREYSLLELKIRYFSFI